MKLTSLLCAAALAFGVEVTAQDLNTPADFSVPESPAFTALGVAPQTVSRPAAPSTFATSLLNAVDDQGKLQNGLAIDFTPYLVFQGYKLTITQYRERSSAGEWRRILAHTNVSFATTKRTDSDTTQRLSSGVHFTVFDFGDPRMDTELLDCYEQAALDILTLLSPPSPRLDADKPTITSMKSAAVAACAVEAAKRNRNRSSWIIAAAPIWVTPTGEVNDLKSDGGAIWTSLAYGFDGFQRVTKKENANAGSLKQRAQIIVHARWRTNEHIKGSDGVVVDHDSRVFGARFRMTGEKTNSSIEISRLRDSTVAGDSSKWRALIGLEQRVAEGAWLQLSFGRESAKGNTGEQLVVRTSFRWAFNATPTAR